MGNVVEIQRFTACATGDHARTDVRCEVYTVGDQTIVCVRKANEWQVVTSERRRYIWRLRVLQCDNRCFHCRE